MTQQETQEAIRQACVRRLNQGECPPFHALLSPRDAHGLSSFSYSFGDCLIHPDPTLLSPGIYVLSQREWAVVEELNSGRRCSLCGKFEGYGIFSGASGEELRGGTYPPPTPLKSPDIADLQREITKAQVTAYDALCKSMYENLPDPATYPTLHTYPAQTPPNPDEKRVGLFKLIDRQAVIFADAGPLTVKVEREKLHQLVRDVENLGCDCPDGCHEDDE